MSSPCLFNCVGSCRNQKDSNNCEKEMGLTDGLIRMSIGLDNDIERTYQMMKACMKELGIL